MEWLCTMSAAKGMWYQSESKLKMPRSSASLVVSPQCAKTKPTTPTVTIQAAKTKRCRRRVALSGGPPLRKL